MFRLDGHRILEVTLSGQSVRALTGSMIAYEGDVSFRNAGIGGGSGLRGALTRRMTGEGLDLMECSGHGVVRLAHDAEDVHLEELNGDTLQVESSALLALGPGLRTDVTFTGLRGAASGQGLFTTTVTGQGQVALLSDGPLMRFAVTEATPLVVDPDAYVASRGQLRQDFVTQISWRDAVGEGSGEAFSLSFQGRGTVLVQPAER